MPATPSLRDSILLGAIHAPNRIFMSPLTRGRSTRAHVPTPVMADYYAQRAGAGLIITEATGISQQGMGWPYAPGIWSPEQVEAWKPIVAAVHAAGGRIVCQLWHMGRLVHPDFLGGAQPVAPSPIAAPGDARTYSGPKPYTIPRPLSIGEIPALLDEYARAADNAMAAGFDGVQIHGANGYLIDEFLRDGANHRTDAYGGSPENRARLAIEIGQRVTAAIGGDRVGIRVSPNGDVYGANDSDPHATYGYLAQQLDAVGIAWIEVREPPQAKAFPGASPRPVHPVVRQNFSGKLVLNAEYTPAEAEAAVESGEADAMAFGRAFLANPDLPDRIRRGLPLNAPRPALFYTQGAEGYTDYPAYSG